VLSLENLDRFLKSLHGRAKIGTRGIWDIDDIRYGTSSEIAIVDVTTLGWGRWVRFVGVLILGSDLSETSLEGIRTMTWWRLKDLLGQWGLRVQVNFGWDVMNVGQIQFKGGEVDHGVKRER
jgi:hypothetical protein